MRRAVVAWLGFWFAFGLLDWWADRRGRSLSTATRHLFRTHTPNGRRVFGAVHWCGAWVLWRHIVKR